MVNPLSSSLRVVVTPNTIINQKRHTLYYLYNEEMLCATATTCLVAIENEKLMSWKNHTSGQHSHELEYTIGFESLTSTRLSTRISLSNSLNGVEIRDTNSGIYKKFLPEEMSPERRLKTRVAIPAHSDLYFYQSKYVLETEVYFTHDGWSRLCVVVSNDDAQTRRWRIRSTVHSAEFTTTDQELQEVVEMNMFGQTKQDVYGDSQRRFDDLTDRAKDTLRGFD
ncbi:hypothetical protein V8B97DRAFT_436691 [Scleroderma yunnanense]